jgi:hypothetical protein
VGLCELWVSDAFDFTLLGCAVELRGGPRNIKVGNRQFQQGFQGVII